MNNLYLASFAMPTEIYVAGAALAVFLSALLLFKKQQQLPDTILALWLLLTGYHLWRIYLVMNRQYTVLPELLGTELPLPLVHGPFLFIYTAALTGTRKMRAAALLHFLPLLAAYALLSSFFLLSPEQKQSIYRQEGRGYTTQVTVIFIAILVSGIAYIAASLQLLRRYSLAIRQRFSNTEKINLKWLRYLIWGLAVIWLAVLFAPDTYIFTAVALYILLIGLFGIRWTGIFTYNKNAELVPEEQTEASPDGISLLLQPEESASPEAGARYTKSRLSKETIRELQTRLNEIMEQERLYTQPELSLGELGKRMKVHPNILSQVINEGEEKNFYDYVNLWRIRAFEQMAADPGNKKYTLLSLAFECGFNSKASFNRNFKKHKGCTPTEYQQQLPDGIS